MFIAPVCHDVFKGLGRLFVKLVHLGWAGGFGDLRDFIETELYMMHTEIMSYSLKAFHYLVRVVAFSFF